MAVRSYTVFNPQTGVYVVKWEGLLRISDGGGGHIDDSGAPFICPQFADKSVQVIGTLGVSGAVTIQGTNMITAPTYATLNDAEGDALVVTALGIRQVLENTYAIRPIITNGEDAVTDLDVYLIVSTVARR